MAHAVAVETDGDALVLTFQNGPSNALTAPLRAELQARIAAAGAPHRRILITASGPDFCGAVPLEPDTQSPRLADLCAAVEAAALPVIAVLSGLVVGAGAELALAARVRIAAPGTRIAFPEVALGLCPVGGSTLRLPRLVGAERALDLLLTGRPLVAEQALAIGLIDGISPAPLAHALSATTLPPRRSLVPAEPAVIAAARRARPGALPAVRRLIACVEAAALLPPEAHRAFEAVAREDLESSPEAAALRAVARADRRAALLPPMIVRQDPPPVTRLALSGADPALVLLAEAALTRGLDLAWRHPDADRQAESLAALAAALARSGAAVPAGLTNLPPDAPDHAPLQVHDARAPVGLRRPVPGVAHLVLGGAEGELGLALGPGPRFCELAIPADEAAEAAGIAIAVAGLRRLGWQPLIVGRSPVLGRRVVAAGQAALDRMARMGVPRAALDRALAGFGQADPQGAPGVEEGSPLSSGAVLARWLGAQANEGLRLLDQGLARRPSDIDLALVMGHGFPRWQGGPMHLADRLGLMALRRNLRAWAGEDPVWSPAPLLDRLIQDGLRLSALDGG